MRVLITGGAGFLGSNLADRLLARGNDVLVVDNFATARHDTLKERKGLELVEATIADTALVNQLFARFVPEVVVHAAASYKDPQAWTEDTRTNVLGTANIVRAAAQTAVRRLIYFQTALCYGLRPEQQPISVDHPLDPGDSSYAITKTAGEYFVRKSGLDYISFRLANVYGPRNLSGPLPTFYQRLAAGKPCFVVDTRRDFTYVDDLVAVVIKAIDGQGRSGVYHVSSGGDYAIKELYDAVLAALELTPGVDVEIRPRSQDDAFTILLDPTETERDFGWKAMTPLAEGVRRTIAWYTTHGVTETYTHLTLDKARS